ncbi:nitrate ABC transporter [Cutibacterium sp. WCA-380-WT-3A]|uniref:Nitrate ABC transporter n=1 Tax=Cutibacterium porci TaxID=2605781 RepID=A0A7K0J4J7_9ACTN|nr:nitrate ABC transporter [Cutibacterium porci]MSS44842.1 nitrate ABC transporter [Cutibacterium porci]
MLIQRANITDIWFEGGEALVVVNSCIFRLSPLAVTIWEVLETPLEFEELRCQLEPLVGPPPEGTLTEALATFIDDLSHNGIVTTS